MAQLAFAKGIINYHYFQQFPNQPTLISLHDSLGCIQLWRDFPKLIGELTAFNVLIYDRFGYGKSSEFVQPARENNYMELEADFLFELIEKLQLNKCVLFGHSDGGSIALIAASKYPSKIAGIITEGAHVFVEEITLNGIKAVKEIYEKTNLKEKLEKYHANKTQALFEAWTETWLNTRFFSWNIEHFLPQIKCPVLILQGVGDEFGSETQVQVIVKNCTNAKNESYLIPNAKHTPHKEARDWTVENTVRFIKKIMETNPKR